MMYELLSFVEVSDEDVELPAMPTGKIGAKKMRKLQAKAERKAQREVNTPLHNTNAHLISMTAARRSLSGRHKET